MRAGAPAAERDECAAAAEARRSRPGEFPDGLVGQVRTSCRAAAIPGSPRR